MAEQDGLAIVTKDTDFLDLSMLRGAPPKVVLLHTGNVPTSHIATLLRAHAAHIATFVADPIEAILFIDR